MSTKSNFTVVTLVILNFLCNSPVLLGIVLYNGGKRSWSPVYSRITEALQREPLNSVMPRLKRQESVIPMGTQQPRNVKAFWGFTVKRSLKYHDQLSPMHIPIPYKVS